MNENWYENLTEKQEKLTKLATGLLDDIVNVFDLLAEDMDEKQANICKMGYVTTLIHCLGIKE